MNETEHIPSPDNIVESYKESSAMQMTPCSSQQYYQAKECILFHSLPIPICLTPNGKGRGYLSLRKRQLTDITLNKRFFKALYAPISEVSQVRLMCLQNNLVRSACGVFCFMLVQNVVATTVVFY